MGEVTDPTIVRMMETIVEEIHPEKIILFGSYAKGDARPDSDVDFLIVDSKSFGPQRSRRKEMARIWKALGEFMLSVDILLYTPTELDIRKNSINSVVARALREGIVLYERH